MSTESPAESYAISMNSGAYRVSETPVDRPCRILAAGLHAPRPHVTLDFVDEDGVWFVGLFLVTGFRDLLGIWQHDARERY
jgi:hypothetical protein